MAWVVAVAVAEAAVAMADTTVVAEEARVVRVAMVVHTAVVPGMLRLCRVCLSAQLQMCKWCLVRR